MDNSENDSDSSTSWVIVDSDNAAESNGEKKESSPEIEKEEMDGIPEIPRETVEELNMFREGNVEHQSESDISVITDSEENCSYDEDSEMPNLLYKLSSDSEEEIVEKDPVTKQLVKKPVVRVEQNPLQNILPIIAVVIIAYVGSHVVDNFNLSLTMRMSSNGHLYLDNCDEDISDPETQAKVSYDYDDQIETIKKINEDDYENLADDKYVPSKDYKTDDDQYRHTIFKYKPLKPDELKHIPKRKNIPPPPSLLQHQTGKQLKVSEMPKNAKQNDTKESKKNKDWKKNNKVRHSGLQTDDDHTSKKWKKYKGDNKKQFKIVEQKPKKPLNMKTNKKQWKEQEKYLSGKERYLLKKEFRLWKNERRVNMIRNTINLRNPKDFNRGYAKAKNKSFSGEWYLRMHQERAKNREATTKSDWLFERARMRNKKRKFY